MYSHALTVLAAFAASPAAASSIDIWSTIPIANPPSIIQMTCTACVKAAPSAKPSGYDVPDLAQGQQRLSVEDRGGKPALVRTEAWMGGSPVTFVSINPVWIDTEKGILAGRENIPAKGDGVDLQATTSAVSPPSGPATVEPAAAELVPTQPVVVTPAAPDFSGLELRPSR